MKMSRDQELQVVVKQRLTAAVEEIVGLFAITIAEYEKDAARSREEIDRQGQLLDAVRLHRETLPSDLQQLLVNKEEVSTEHCEQQEWSPSLDQEDSESEPPHIEEEEGDIWISPEGEQLLEEPEPPHIKEEQDELWISQIKGEQDELWISQEGERLQRLEEADMTESPFSAVPEENEDEEDEPQSSQLHQSQTEENREAEPLPSCSTEQMETYTDDGEDCGVSEAAKNLDLIYPPGNSQLTSNDKTSDYSVTEDSDDEWVKPIESQSGLYTQKNSKVLGKKHFNSSVCGKRFGNKARLVHTGDTLFNCSVCGKGFGRKGNLKRHMIVHRGDRPFKNLKRHMKVHPADKPFNCSVCGKGFGRKGGLKTHMIVHTGETQFSCSVCSKGFARKEDLKRHMMVHTGDTQFNCSVCGRGFGRKGNLKRHMIVHRGDKQFNCSVCDKGFGCKGDLRRHMEIHTGE